MIEPETNLCESEWVSVCVEGERQSESSKWTKGVRSDRWYPYGLLGTLGHTPETQQCVDEYAERRRRFWIAPKFFQSTVNEPRCVCVAVCRAVAASVGPIAHAEREPSKRK